MGNLMQGTSSAALAAYQNVTGNITANADTILSQKVRNIETVCKMLDTQGDVVKKMLKESIEGNSKLVNFIYKFFVFTKVFRKHIRNSKSTMDNMIKTC